MNWKEIYDKTEQLCNVLSGRSQKEPDEKELQDILAHLKDHTYLQKKMEEQESYDYKKAFQNLPRKRRSFHTFFSMAAVIVLLLTVGTVAYQYFQTSQEDYSKNVKLAMQWAEIEHGGHKAVLVKDNGERVRLTEQPAYIHEQDSLQIQVDSCGLHYEIIQSSMPEVDMRHTLLVPKGGEYTLVLADGTKVWLNADSELIYPVTFSGDTREVEVRGEAYFKVSKDIDRPFIVKTVSGDVRVWGTEFNVQAYPENEKTITTLVNGKVSYLFTDGEEIFMKPSEELTADAEGKRSLRTVDTRYACSWKNGKFFFENKTLEELLLQLGKWYDVEVRFKDEAARELHFSGDLSRYKNIGTFIDMFEQCSDAQFTYEEGVLTVGLEN